VPTQEDATTVRTATTSCYNDPDGIPDDYTVWVYEHDSYRGTCRILLPGFYPSSSNIGIPNDSMSSIRIGAGVRARLFEHTGYKGAYWVITGHVSYLGSIFLWNDLASSMRVELADRAQNCRDVRDGEMALFVDSWYMGDCVVLPVQTWFGYAITYPNASAMGIGNDSISSLMYRSQFSAEGFFWHVNRDYVNGACYKALPNQDIGDLPRNYGAIIGPHDQISSIGPIDSPWWACALF
jgi:hypothetical protein